MSQDTERLNDALVANLATYAADAKPTTREVESLAREVQASRKLVADLRADHHKTYKTTSDEVWETNPVCTCGHGWPCDIERMIDEAGL